MDDTPHIRHHIEDARRALAPVAALFQRLDIEAAHAAEEPTPEMRAELTADVHRALAALAEGADALLGLRDRLGVPTPEPGAAAGRARDTEGG